MKMVPNGITLLMFPGPRPLSARGSTLESWDQGMKVQSLISSTSFRHLCEEQTGKAQRTSPGTSSAFSEMSCVDRLCKFSGLCVPCL